MILIETNRTTPVYSNAGGKEKALKKEDRLFSSDSKKSRKDLRMSYQNQINEIDKQVLSGKMTKEEARTKKKEIRKNKRVAKKEAIKLQLTKRFTKNGKPLFIYRLNKLKVDTKSGKLKKYFGDGTSIEVSKSDAITTPQGTFDKNDIAKALNIPTSSVTQEIVNNSTMAVTTSSSGSETATETSKSTTSADLAVKVPTENIVNTTTGEEGEEVSYQTGDNVFLEKDTLPATNTGNTEDTEENKDKDENTDTKTKTPMKTWEKILLFGGIAVVLGLVTFAIVKKKK